MRIVNTNQPVDQKKYVKNHEYAFARYRCLKCSWRGDTPITDELYSNWYVCPECNGGVCENE